MQPSLIDISANAFQLALRSLAAGVAGFVPRLVVALVAFVILWIVAVAIGKLVEQVIRALKVDHLLTGLGVEEPISRAGFKLDTGAFLGGLVRWFFLIVAFLVAVDILNLPAVSSFLTEVVSYLPNVAVAALIVIAAALVSDVAQKVAKGSAQAVGIPSAGLVGAVVRWSIWVFAVAVALIQLRITPDLINNMITAVVAMLALAGGLAFGLGGKEHASQFIEKLKREMRG